MKKAIILLSAITLLLISCEDKKKENTTYKNELIEKYEILKDSLDNGWGLYSKKEDIILDNMDHTLQHLTYSATYDKLKHRKLEREVKKLRTLRYPQDNFTNLDKFDHETDQLILDLTEFVEETEDASLAVISDFLNEMNSENGYLINYRIKYDSYVFAYNDFIEKNMKQLKELGINKKDLKKFPTFSIIDDADTPA